MKTQKSTKSFSKSTKRYANRAPMSKFLISSLNGLFSGNRKSATAEGFFKIGSVVVGHRTRSIIIVSFHFITYCLRIRKGNNLPFLVKYLKAAHVLTMQAASGMRIPNSHKLGVAISRTGKGVPRIIPRILRSRILKGDPVAIRGMLTLLSVYRILEFPGTVKTSTITNPGKDFQNDMVEISHAIRLFWKIRPGKEYSVEKLLMKPFPIQKSASTSTLTDETQISTSMFSLIRAAVAGCNGPMDLIENYCNQTFNDVLMEYIFMISEEALHMTKRLASLGRLGFKEEAAGKVRVFAMVDPYTNWLLRPLHKLLFKYLSRIDQDGTFDQEAPIKLLQSKGLMSFGCYDLSAATDRLPILLQKKILAYVIGESLAEAGGDLLVKRGYYSKVHRSEIKYAVGQPMGALSSWAMLALTHHFIIQGAAMRVHAVKHKTSGRRLDSKVSSFSWFRDYAILGDDIVIGNGAVAREYVLIMNILGVEIGFAKSLVSHRGGLEFAKRFFIGTRDCSPVAFKELFAARGQVSALLQFKKKGNLRTAQIMDIMGQGYKVRALLTKRYHAMPKRLANLLHLMHAPIPGQMAVSDWVERFSMNRVTKKDNWPAVLGEYHAFQFNRLADALEHQQKLGNMVADTVDEQREADRFLDRDGLVLDGEKSKFAIKSPLDNPKGLHDEDLEPISDRVRGSIFMILHYPRMQEVFKEIKDIEQEMLIESEYIMGLKFNAYEVFTLLEEAHIRMTDFETKISLIAVPTIDGEYRPSNDDIILRKNPMLLAKLGRRLDQKLRSKLEPGLAARILDIEFGDRDC